MYVCNQKVTCAQELEEQPNQHSNTSQVKKKTKQTQITKLAENTKGLNILYMCYSYHLP